MANIENSFLVDLKHNGDFGKTSKGDLALIAGKDNIRQAIFNRLITVAGTIVHRPDYGVGIKQWQGSVGTLSKQRELALVIKSQLEQDNRIDSVNSVTIIQDEEIAAGAFIITVKVTVPSIGEYEETFNPFG